MVSGTEVGFIMFVLYTVLYIVVCELIGVVTTAQS